MDAKLNEKFQKIVAQMVSQSEAELPKWLVQEAKQFYLDDEMAYIDWLRNASEWVPVMTLKPENKDQYLQELRPQNYEAKMQAIKERSASGSSS